MSRQTVREIGEFGLIAALREVLPGEVRADRRLRVGIGDDAAVWLPAAREALVVTTDSLVDNIHFRLDWTDWTSLGHKLLAVNISDIAAMGGVPRLATISLGLRGDEQVDDLREMYRGIGALAKRHGVMVAGGDIVASPEALTIHVTVIGQTRHGRFLPRSTAKVGDVIAVSGTLGASAAGLRLLQEDGARRNAATADQLIAAHLRPEPRVALGRVLIERRANAAMDLSDGLFGDLPKILAASGVSAVVDAGRIPVAAAVRALFSDDWFALATRGGEDYELLFTASPEAFAEIELHAPSVGSTVTAIGEIIAASEKPVLQLRRDVGELEPVVSGAFDHFTLRSHIEP